MHYSQNYWDDVSKVIEHIPNVNQIFGKNILVTGATGMVCSSVIDVIAWMNHHGDARIQLMLAGRNREKIASRFRDVLSLEEYQFIEYDATKDQRLSLKVDFIIHGASNANPAIYAKEPVETLLGNVVGLNNVLNVAEKNPGSRILYISSSEVYGNKINGDNRPYKEEDYGFVDILNPRACYPNGKRTAETLCAAYAQKYGVDFVTVRLGHIYGPSITKADTRASAAFTRDVAAGQNIVMKSAGAQLRSYCYTLDCASAILTVLLNGESGNAYNISNKDSIVSIRDMAEALAAEGGVEVIFENPSDVERKSYNLMSNSALNAEKVEGLGWKPLFNLEEGTRRTIQFY